MNKKSLSYQINAVNAAIDHLQDNYEFKLQSPTGSGKTFIIAQMIDRYLENVFLNNEPTSFIFIAPSTGGLDYQGYEKISSYLKRDWVKGFDTEYIGTSKNNKNSSNKSYLQNIDYFKTKTVYFFGWQMFKKGTRITEIDSEKNDIYKVISNTKEKGINIVLIIDEAHREINSTKDEKNTKEIILEELKPYKLIKVSATLDHVNEKPDYVIEYEDVRSECAIKQNVIISQINTNIRNIDLLNEEEQLILSAIEKQKEIKQAYSKNKIEMNPLILIQIPDNFTIDKDIKTEDQLLNKINSILEKQGYKKGYNYAIWLDKNKTNKDKNEIINNDSSIDILIFKTAIATGWDIPRANILVRIREAKTKSFNIQTLGRILRNPFFKYYNNELIDNAFVYTKDEKYKEYIKEDKIILDENDFKIVKRSRKSKNSNFSINKVLINSIEYNESQMIDIVTQKILAMEDFKLFLEYNHHKTIAGSSIIESQYVLDATKTSKFQKEFEKKKMSNQNQSILDFSLSPNITLFELYVKYKTVTRSSIIISKILDNICSKINIFNKKIKDFYWACIYNWNTFVFEINDNTYTLENLIEKEKNIVINLKTNKYYEKYSLPNEYKVSTKKFDISKWDEINTFNVSLKTEELDSKHEKYLYKKWKDDEIEEIHIFRNGTSSTYDYFVEYLDNESKKRRFFPDFIIVNEKRKTCLILEAKGENQQDNIDKNSKNKFDALIDSLKKNKIKNSFDCKTIIKVTSIEEESIYIDKSENKQIKYKDIKKMLEID